MPDLPDGSFAALIAAIDADPETRAQVVDGMAQPDEIAWTLINTEDWGGGLERTYRAENVEHAQCGGDIHLTHLHDEMGAVTGAHSRCAKCGEDLTA